MMHLDVWGCTSARGNAQSISGLGFLRDLNYGPLLLARCVMKVFQSKSPGRPAPDPPGSNCRGLPKTPLASIRPQTTNTCTGFSGPQVPTLWLGLLTSGALISDLHVWASERSEWGAAPGGP